MRVSRGTSVITFQTHPSGVEATSSSRTGLSSSLFQTYPSEVEARTHGRQLSGRWSFQTHPRREPQTRNSTPRFTLRLSCRSVCTTPRYQPSAPTWNRCWRVDVVLRAGSPAEVLRRYSSEGSRVLASRSSSRNAFPVSVKR